MRLDPLPVLPFLIATALFTSACSDVEGAETPAAEETEADRTDELAKRAVQLMDSASQVLVEVADKAPVETAAGTLKALGVELSSVLDELSNRGVALSSDPKWSQAWSEAQLGLQSALSTLTAKNPYGAKILTSIVENPPFGQR